MFQTEVVGKIKTHILCSVTPQSSPMKIVPFMILYGKNCKARRAKEFGTISPCKEKAQTALFKKTQSVPRCEHFKSRL
jgi:hypothetical protein